MLRFVLFGFPVRVHGIFWLTSLLLSQPTGFDRASLVRLVTWTAIVFVSILVHELGHALAMRACGRGASIDLVALGGLTSWGTGARVSGWKNALVSLSGPAAGFVFAAPVLLLATLGPRLDAPWARDALRAFLWVNVGWGALNLLPILPLDGGRILQATLVTLWGEPGGRAARVLSLVLGVAVGLAALRFGLTWIAFLAGLGVAQTWGEKPLADASIPETRATSEQAVAGRRALDDGWSLLWAGRAEDAERVALESLAVIPDTAEDGGVRAALIELVAWTRLDRDDVAGARAALRQLPTGHEPARLLVARMDLPHAATAAALRDLEDAFWRSPTEHGALVVAMAHLDAQEPALAVQLFRRLDRGRLGQLAMNRIAAALFHARQYEAALELEELAWERHRDSTAAYNAACSLSRLGRIDEGLDWLRRALGAGFDDASLLETDDDIGALRADPRFAALAALAARATRARDAQRR